MVNAESEHPRFAHALHTTRRRRDACLASVVRHYPGRFDRIGDHHIHLVDDGCLWLAMDALTRQYRRRQSQAKYRATEKYRQTRAARDRAKVQGDRRGLPFEGSWFIDPDPAPDNSTEADSQ